MGKLVFSRSYGFCKRSLKYSNLQLGTKKNQVHFCSCFLMYHFILKLFPQTWHWQFDLCDYSCGKDIYGNALSNMWKITQDNLRIAEHLKKNLKLFTVGDFNSSDIFYKIHNFSSRQVFPCLQFLRRILKSLNH